MSIVGDNRNVSGEMDRYLEHEENKRKYREDFIRKICSFEEYIGLKCLQK